MVRAKQIVHLEDATMQNQPIYCVELAHGPAIFKTPHGPRKIAVSIGYATGYDNFLSYADASAGLSEISTFSQVTANKMANAWRKLGYRVHVKLHKATEEPLTV